MVELYTGVLAVFIVLSVLTGIYVILKRRMPGSKVGGVLILVGAAWSLSYFHQLVLVFSEDLIRSFLFKSAFSYIFPALFVVYLFRFFELRIPKLVNAGIVTIPTIFSLFQFSPIYRHILIKELIIYNQNQVAPKYTAFGVVPILYTYLLSAILFTYFIKTLLSRQNILKIRVVAFLIATTIFELSYTIDVFNLNPLGHEFTPLLVNIMSIGVAIFSTERLYKRDVLPSVFSSMMEDIGDLLIVTDTNDRVIYLNAKARETSKLENIGFLDKYVWDVFPSLTVYSGERVQTLAADEKTYDVQSYFLRDWQNKNRSKVHIMRDVTELIEYQYNLESLVEEKSHELMQSERMAAIGETTLMVGHDLRNPLQVVKFLTHKLRKDLDDDPSTSELLTKIDSNLNYMDKIVSDLSLFAKNANPDVQETTLIDLIENCLIKINVPDDVIIDYDFDFGIQINVDPNMIERVFNNLLLNAVQAMPDGGVIRIEAENQDGRNIVRISDSGDGIQEEMIEDLFKPLHTTKPKGVGMGLAVCKKIVNLHKGDISVDPDYPDGACFVIEVPIIDATGS